MSSEAISTGRKEEGKKGEGEGEASLILGSGRKEKRKVLKKLKRKQIRKEVALKQREEEEARLNDEEEQRKLLLKEHEEREMMERQRKEFEERERLWMERAAKLAQEEEEKEARRKLLEEESRQNQVENDELKDDDDWEYVEEGPAEIIWQGNEIIVKKKRVKVAKRSAEQQACIEDVNRPTSNPLPPQSEAYSSYRNTSVSSQQVFESVSQQNPNFGTEQDKAHCPFHIKTGACRFGVRCSRAHFYPDKSCTLLIKNMYNGPGLAWEQDEGLEYTDEEIERSYEEFYEDVHTEFLKFGEIVNFKVCKNGSSHLRGNVYVNYKSLESAILAYDTMNARYFAGKQITCEYVGVTRWRVAICGEYMKSRLKNCSRGTACNFIHCFRNPGGEYEWADWDNPPPKHWVVKMASLFGPSAEIGYDWGPPRNSKRKSEKHERSSSRRSISRDFDSLRSSSSGDDSSGKRDQQRTPHRKKHSAHGKKMDYVDGRGRFEEKFDFEDDQYRDKNRHHDRDIDGFSTKNADRYYGQSRSNSNQHSKGRDHCYSHAVKKGCYDSDSHFSHKRGPKSHDYSSGPKFSETTDVSDRWETGSDFPDESKKSKDSDYDDNEASTERYMAHDHSSGMRHKRKSRSRSRSSHRSHSKHRKETENPYTDGLDSREDPKHHHVKHKSEGNYKKHKRRPNEDSKVCHSSENSSEKSDIEDKEDSDSLKHKSGSQHLRKHRNSSHTREPSRRSRARTKRSHENVDNDDNTV